MNGRAIYNEHEPFAAEWLRNLVSAGHIAGGDVDARSIRDLRASDVADATQAHFFAGVGVWSYALKLAGWPNDAPVWTGSCPCQPFSDAGRKRGFDDDRHLWPDWFRLIRECRPPVILGEQVASAGAWLDLVSSDLEREGYAFGASVLGAHSVGAPHIRQRVYFVAVARRQRREGLDALLLGRGPRQARAETAWRGEAGELEYAGSERRERRQAPAPGHLDDGSPSEWTQGQHGPRVPGSHRSAAASELGHASGTGLSQRERDGRLQPEALGPRQGQATERGSNSSFWSDAEWIACTDGKARPVEPGTFPLAHGAPTRVGRLRAYGNALVAETARCFVSAVMEIL